MLIDFGIYGLLWLSFGVLHSVLARPSVKKRFALGQFERLAYNGFAVAHLGAVWVAGRFWLFTQSEPFSLPQAAQIFMVVLVVTGLVVLFLALRSYDLGDFSGLKQVRGHAHFDDGPLVVSGLNHYVRHPLYSGLFLLLWGQASDPFGLATALWASVYILIGSRFEEQALLKRFGSGYTDYKARTPAFFPHFFSRVHAR